MKKILLTIPCIALLTGCMGTPLIAPQNGTRTFAEVTFPNGTKIKYNNTKDVGFKTFSAETDTNGSCKVLVENATSTNNPTVTTASYSGEADLAATIATNMVSAFEKGIEAAK